uniref:AMP-dependent synthetase/ligase domain-containing protein n=1 Tax=Bionectria ochroleuca TaxID=29856 RepID=A0A8H7K697_BIOOC
MQKPPFTIPSPGYEKVEGETLPRRNRKAKDGLVDRPAKGVGTVWDLISRSARLYPDRKAVGSRKLITIHNVTQVNMRDVDGKLQEVESEWNYFELSPYQFITYEQYYRLVRQLGSGLHKLGMPRHSKLHMFATTSVCWMSLAHACASRSICLVTAYDTLGEDGLAHSLVQTDATVMYIDTHLLPKAQKPIRKSQIKTVIVNTECIFGGGDKEVAIFKRDNPDLRVITYEELRQLGEDNPATPYPPMPEETYCIMYTSGSTGIPKGVSIRHESLVAGVTGLFSCVEDWVGEDECILAYLPSAHIFELVVENLVFLIGGSLGYGSARTLADTSVRNCAGDLRELKPTVLVGVPQVWETIKKGIIAQVNSITSSVLRGIFWGAFYYKGFMVDNNILGASLLDFVFKAIREKTGGRLRYIMNGASGIAPETRRFLSLVLAPMLVGYGLTESCANGALTNPSQYTRNTIGPIPASIDLKLVSIPDLGYVTTGKTPQGEIWIKGKPVLSEYYRNPEETAKAVTPDGWFKTGDIGEFDAKSGNLNVIDRVKNLIKMQGGEYIAVEKLEAIYRSAHSVSNVMVHAEDSYPRPIAIVIPNPRVVIDLAQDLPSGCKFNESNLHLSLDAQSVILHDLRLTAWDAGLSGIEIIANVVISHEEWTPATGLVTVTEKLNRRVIVKTFHSQIKEAFKLDQLPLK